MRLSEPSWGVLDVASVPTNISIQSDADGFCICCSFRRSALRLTCRIASRPITTWVRPSATTVGVCCGEWSNKASSVKVRKMLFYWWLSLICFPLCFTMSLSLSLFLISNVTNSLCSECSMNVHHKCQTKVANLCGINQKLLAEALTQVSLVSDSTSCPAITFAFYEPKRSFLGLWCIFMCGIMFDMFSVLLVCNKLPEIKQTKSDMLTIFIYCV